MNCREDWDEMSILQICGCSTQANIQNSISYPLVITYLPVDNGMNGPKESYKGKNKPFREIEEVVVFEVVWVDFLQLRCGKERLPLVDNGSIKPENLLSFCFDPIELEL